MKRRAPGPALAVALAVVTLARLPAAWAGGGGLNHVSGAWMTLADDLAHGVLYRPAYDPALGFGGTRFFPLAFALHGLLLRAGAPLLPSGFALSLAAGLGLAAGAFACARALGVPRDRALAAAALALSGGAAQQALTAVRGDLPAAALVAFGLAAVLRGRTWPATVLFTLAFAAKPTALAPAAAAVAWLALRGDRRAAARLGAGVALGSLAAVAITQALSGGRFLEHLAAAATAGATARDLLAAPVKLARLLVREDPAGLVLVGLAVGVLGRLVVRRARHERWEHLPGLALLASVLALLFILGSPGTGVNHLVELEALAAIALGTVGLGADLGLRPDSDPDPDLTFAPTLALAAGLLSSLGLLRADLASHRLADVRCALAASAGPGPLLSEDPLVPLLDGERPLVADAFMLRLHAARDPSLVAPLADGLARGAFRAAVLLRPLDDPGAAAWYASESLGPALAAAVARTPAAPAIRCGRYTVYRPAGPPAPSLAPAPSAAEAEVARGAPAR